MSPALLSNYARDDVAFVEGKGRTLWDAEGRAYLDFCAGVAVNALGHAHPAWVKAVQDQAARLVHTSNLVEVPLQERLAKRLAEVTGLAGGAFFANSGSEAVEAAIKLARLHARQEGLPPDVVVTEGAFHGRTMGALTATAHEAYRAPFAPLVGGFRRVPFGSVGPIEAALEEGAAAVLLEPIQGEGGIRVPPPGYLARVRRACDDAGALLVLDEVQTGIGRTGAWLAAQHEDVAPDIVALAKGLGGGFPVGAVVAHEKAAVFTPGSHGSTFGGNPLACAAALATLETIAEEGLLENAGVRGKQLLKGLSGQGWAARGRGLLVGFDVPESGPTAVAWTHRLREAGLLTSAAGPSTLRLTPPLNVTEAEVEQALALVAGTVLAPSAA